MEKAQVIIERTYNASVERVWTALTDIEQMKQWYMPALTSFQPEVGWNQLINTLLKDFVEKITV